VLDAWKRSFGIIKRLDHQCLRGSVIIVQHFSHHQSYWPGLDEYLPYLHSRRTDGPEKLRALSFVIGESLNRTRHTLETTPRRFSAAEQNAPQRPSLDFLNACSGSLEGAKPLQELTQLATTAPSSQKEELRRQKSVFLHHRRHDEAPSAGRATTAHELGRHGYTS